MSTPPREAPPRLATGESPVGKLLEKASSAPAETSTARRERVWRSLEQGPRRSPLRWLVPVGVAAAVAALFVLLPTTSRGTVAFVRGEVVSDGTQVQVGQRLGNGASVRTGDHGRTFIRSTGAGALLLENTRAQLARNGELLLQQGLVLSSSRSLAIVAGEYRIEGSSFAVRVGADQTVEVFAHDASVQVRGTSGQFQLSAAHAWSSVKGPSAQKGDEAEHALAHALAEPRAEEAALDIPGPEGAEVTVDGVPMGLAPLKLLAAPGARVDVKQAEAPAPKAAASDSYERAVQLERDGHADQALALHEELARGNGPRAEASLYVAGRLLLQVFGDADGALKKFTECQRRFPNGSLAPEVALSAIEAQLKLNQLEPAMAAMDAFVAHYPDSERLNEVHFLQAQVHSQRGECALALPLFAALLEDPKRADDALYLTAYCERALNNHAAARRHLLQYLARFPAGKHQAEAKAALGKR